MSADFEKTKLERLTITMPNPLYKWLQRQCKARNHTNMSRAVQDLVNDRIEVENESKRRVAKRQQQSL